MTIEWMDNFSLYGTGTGPGNAAVARMGDGLYAERGIGAALVQDPDVNATGVVFRYGSDPDVGFRRVFGGDRARVGIAQRIYLTNLPFTSSAQIVSFRDNLNNTICVLDVLTTGALRFRHGPSLALAITTTGPVIVPNAWQHVEILVNFSATVGTVEVRVEGLTVLIADTLNVGANCAQVANVYNVANSRVHAKDYIAYNGLGSFNTTFIGSCTVLSLVPSSDVALNWTPSVGSNGWSLIDEAGPPNDADFISAPFPLPAAYQAGLTNLPVDVTSVRALQTITRARKTDGGDGNLQQGLVSGASTGLGSNRAITTAFTYWFDVFETDPATAALWTPTAVDAAVLRLNRTV